MGIFFLFLKRGWFAAKVDLNYAYFNLGLSEGLKQIINLVVEKYIFQFQGAFFGLNILPQVWMQVMKTFQKIGEVKVF